MNNLPHTSTPLADAPRNLGSVRPRADMFPNGYDPDAYALVLKGDCLQPTAFNGEMAICSPAAPLKVGSLVALWPADGSTPLLKRLVMEPVLPVGTKLHPDSDAVPLVIVDMLNPPRQMAVRIDKLRAMHRVVGIYREEEIAEMRVPPKPPRRCRKAGVA